MPPFSEDLKRFQELEEKYRKELAEYEAVAEAYRAFLTANPNDPDLAKRYEDVERKNSQAQSTYAELERLRRALAPGAPASS